MRKQGYILIASLFITLIFSSGFIGTIQIVDAQTENFPNSHNEVNSLMYQTASRYIYSNTDKTSGINHSITLSRTFPSDGTLNVTEHWKTNNTTYVDVNNRQFTYNINESSNAKQNYGSYPWYLTGLWMQRFPSNISTENITIAELSLIIRQKITGKPVITGETAKMNTAMGSRNMFVVQINENFEQDCAT
jgi:hypothetical protein